MGLLPYCALRNVFCLTLLVIRVFWLVATIPSSSNSPYTMSAEDFDVERCIELHNQLVQIGWQGSGQDFDNAGIKTWWDMYGAECDKQELTPRLTPEIIDFLKGALEPGKDKTGVNSPYQNFFYYVSGLAMPQSFLSEMFILDGLDEEPPRYVLLYRVTNLISHPLGILLVNIRLY